MFVLVGRVILATAAVVLGTSSSTWAQPQYRVIDLGQEPQLPMGGARINDLGQTFYTINFSSGGGETRAFFWDPNAGETDITGSRYAFVYPQGINAGGQVTGFAYAGGYVAWVFDPHTGFQELGSLFGFRVTHAFGLNDQGDVVGDSFFVGDHGFIFPHAFIWRNGVMTDINDIPIDGGGPWDHFDTANAISNSGVIIGTGTMGGVAHSFMLIPIPQ